jgi:hypothetical protein
MNEAPEKTFAGRCADLIRRFGTDFEGEAVATWTLLKRLLASRNLTFTDLGNDLESLATGGVAEEERNRIYDAAYAEGIADERRKHVEAEAEAQAVFGLKPDGSTDWEAIALYCQREKTRFESRHYDFVDRMAAKSVWGQDPSPREGKYLLSLFRGIGGRMSP